jgi:hypothetical protein
MDTAPANHHAALPGVTWIDGERVVAASVRAVTGADEIALESVLSRHSPVQTGLAIAARCSPVLHTSAGAHLNTTVALAAALAVGDREALLLQVRAATFGTGLALVVDCPACGTTMDLALDVDDLLTPPPADPDRTVGCGEHLLRRPTGDDQLAVAAIALDDPAAATIGLLHRCVTQGDPATLLTADADATLDRADPQAACELALTCVECAAAFTSILDAGEILAREITASTRYFHESVHLLAAHYHWSYNEILELPLSRRRRFVELVSDTAAVGMG